MERKLRKSYLLMFPLFIITLLLVIAIGTWVNATYIRPSLAAFQYTADRLVEEGLDEKRIEEVVRDGGGIIFVHEDGRVEQIGGIRVWEAEEMSVKERTDFFVNANDPYADYKHSIFYDEENKGWLIVSFPVSMRLQVIFASNHTSKDYQKSFLFYLVLGGSLAAILFFFAWYYARHSAKTYSLPLKKVCDSVREISKGNYQVKEQETNIEEYKLLEQDIRQLAMLLEEEKKTTKQLADSKRQMLLDISHDLRNPLATILGYSESLCREDRLSEKEKENYMEVIYRNSMRAHSLMNDLFEYTRLEETAFTVEKERVDISEFLREFAASYVPDLESAGFEAEFEIPEEEYFAMLDVTRMERALGNIVQNSLRYNQSGTKLTLTLSIIGKQATIHIIDNGIGIDKALCDSIFLPFTRVDKARNSKHGGSGLGLSISKKIIEALGGTIRLESGPNQGCDFIINIPLT